MVLAAAASTRLNTVHTRRFTSEWAASGIPSGWSLEMSGRPTGRSPSGWFGGIGAPTTGVRTWTASAEIATSTWTGSTVNPMASSSSSAAARSWSKDVQPDCAIRALAQRRAVAVAPLAAEAEAVRRHGRQRELEQVGRRPRRRSGCRTQDRRRVTASRRRDRHGDPAQPERQHGPRPADPRLSRHPAPPGSPPKRAWGAAACRCGARRGTTARRSRRSEPRGSPLWSQTRPHPSCPAG